ncbi:[protein-PII] uridylyltransferase family protein [Novipirellula artificiosorum]|uniref:Glutamate-ammonia-ligase adenylyltransferase n=1 Tax=Novipirellula artificiosorum TaxID=2528016 RepID=A0A5C6DWX3_9BACT|nr:glutamate-ammonia-ligase adenylyltransferase [Novipirellula artificiosorum]TWU40397.1 Glutamate-ammonia-ligase adenylyltransferase [Novipirellula artificiosorum]
MNAPSESQPPFEKQTTGDDRPSTGRPRRWTKVIPFKSPEEASKNIEWIWRFEGSDSLHASLQKQLIEGLRLHDDPDDLLIRLRLFLDACPDPAARLSSFATDETALQSLLQIFANCRPLSMRLIADPNRFDWLRQSGGASLDRDALTSDLEKALDVLDDPVRAAEVIRDFLDRETSRVIYGEFVRAMVPEKVGRQLSCIGDAVVCCGLNFTLKYLSNQRGTPQMPSGNVPQVTVIGLGHFGAEEMSYGDALELVFLFDRIDSWNQTHREFYEQLVREFTRLLRAEALHPFQQLMGMQVDLRSSPKYETGTRICSSFEAIRIYETSGRTWQRLGYIKARVVAGSDELGRAFLDRLQPWVYHRFISRTDLAEIRTFQHKLQRRTDSDTHGNVATKDRTNHATTDPAASQPVPPLNVLKAPGGRNDINRTVQFLQLLHGGDLKSVRIGNTYDAIVALEQAGCVTSQEASLLSENHARLTRLQHQLTVSLGVDDAIVPSETAEIERIAWRLGIRNTETHQGDANRFLDQLNEVFVLNRRIINHLMLDAPDDGAVVAAETELMLDPDPTAEMVDKTLSKHHLKHPRRAMEDLVSLSTESVPFLSPHRCRHFFSLIAPALLSEIAKTPMPGRTLASLVKVTESLGAKATLWELFAANRPTMQLMVRLCASAPYLVGILVENPGMIDELVDSLLMDRLPSAQRLDAQSMELCRGAQDLDPILHSFKNSAHLTIGVRNILGKESLAATQQSLGDTADACLRRIAEYETECLASQFGDPVTANGDPAELILLGLGKLGGREPNYHSDLDVVFLYSDDGETQRRTGGPRSTTTNRSFFNQLARRVLERIETTGPRGRLYEVEGRLRPTGDEGMLAVSIVDFLKRFDQEDLPLWQWMAICKSRSISGSRVDRADLESRIANVITRAPWRPDWASKIRQLRLRMQETATPGNLKRGEGGTADVEFVSQALTLRFAAQSPEVVDSNTVVSLRLLSEAGHLPEEEALQLIAGYQTIRGVELNLRLMNSPLRHELPREDYLMQNLAFLMNENDSKMIVAACSQARQRNRKLLNRILDRISS